MSEQVREALAKYLLENHAAARKRDGTLRQTWEWTRENFPEVCDNYLTYAAGAIATLDVSREQGRGGDWVLVPSELVEAARLMPRETPTAGHASKYHSVEIQAASIWALDDALKKLDAQPQQAGALTDAERRWLGHTRRIASEPPVRGRDQTVLRLLAIIARDHPETVGEKE